VRLGRRRRLACREMVELVTEYLDGGLTRADQARFESHLAECPHCSEYLAQMRATIAITGHVRPDDLTPDARRDLVALYRRWQTG